MVRRGGWISLAMRQRRVADEAQRALPFHITRCRQKADRLLYNDVHSISATSVVASLSLLHSPSMII